MYITVFIDCANIICKKSHWHIALVLLSGRVTGKGRTCRLYRQKIAVNKQQVLKLHKSKCENWYMWYEGSLLGTRPRK